MNHIAEEIQSYFGISDEENLEHIGVKRRSGRYKWGSGKDPYQRGQDFLSRVEELKKDGWQETPENIADEFGISTTQYRLECRMAKEERKVNRINTARRLAEKEGLGPSEIGRRMGETESTVRGWLKAGSEARALQSKETANLLKERLKELPEGSMIDVGKDAERHLNVSRQNLDTALMLLKREGYEVYSGRIDQVTNPNQKTTQKVLCPPGTEHKEIFDNLDRIHTIKDFITRDGGQTFEKKFNYPTSIDSKRVKILLSDEIGPDGEPGVAKDGIIQLRRGVADLSLGDSRYAQVRILVDGDKYLKGMAVYSDNMPDGVDVLFNSNKTSVEKAYKKIKDDPDNPFGSAIKDADQGGQYWYDPKTGNRVSANTPGAKLGAINKRADEGDWSDWSDTLPSQFLSKQSESLAKKQLGIAKADKQAEFDSIMEINNPTIKKHLLQEFANGCDAAAVDLKAAALPGQKYRVMIPINSLKDNEVYAPSYENGTQLALIRYPHGGIFEIPILTVNNKHQGARKVLDPDIKDAVGVNKKVADQLSGADFDGDTVMCIPTNTKTVKIKNKKPLEQLEGFDPTGSYGPDKEESDGKGNTRYFRDGREYRIMSEGNKGKQMGVISNLITDMTLQGAKDDEIAAAVRHSMVVIDAPKHKLDYKQSEIDNNIAALHERYQGKKTGGAFTIVSKAKGEYSVDKREGSPHINIKGSKDYDPTKPEGALIYKTATDAKLYRVKSTVSKTTGIRTLTTTDGKKIRYNPDDKEANDLYRPRRVVDEETGAVRYTDKTGKITYATEKRLQKSTQMAEADDAYDLVSPVQHPMEIIYADYANSMKSMANKARIEMVNTGKLERNPSATKAYETEVKSLKAKLNEALLNTTKERQALRMVNIELQNKRDSGVLKDRKEEKKAATKALTKYREEVGAVARKKRNIQITDREWEAIQAGAVSDSLLKNILNNTDVDTLRQRATPRTSKGLSTSQIARAKNMAKLGYSTAEIARKFDVSPTTISTLMKGEN